MATQSGGSPASRPTEAALEQRSFSLTRKGFNPEEVRAFLREMADEVRVLRAAAEELQHANTRLNAELAEAEARAAAVAAAPPPEPPELDDAAIVEAVGEQVAGLLRSAHATARDLRERAATELEEARAAAARDREDAELLLTGARVEAEELRTSTAAEVEELRSRTSAEVEELLAGARTESDLLVAEARAESERLVGDARADSERQIDEARAESERLVADARAEAERLVSTATVEGARAGEELRTRAAAEAEELLARARQDAEAIRADAERERRLTVEGAQVARERILADLARRRRVATVQIEQLRAGRERLLVSYGVVRRTLEEVYDEFQRADAEARAAAEEAGRRLAQELGVDVPAAGEAEITEEEAAEEDPAAGVDSAPAGADTGDGTAVEDGDPAAATGAEELTVDEGPAAGDELSATDDLTAPTDLTAVEETIAPDEATAPDEAIAPDAASPFEDAGLDPGEAPTEPVGEVGDPTEGSADPLADAPADPLADAPADPTDDATVELPGDPTGEAQLTGAGDDDPTAPFGEATAETPLDLPAAEAPAVDLTVTAEDPTIVDTPAAGGAHPSAGNGRSPKAKGRGSQPHATPPSGGAQPTGPVQQPPPPGPTACAAGPAAGPDRFYVVAGGGGGRSKAPRGAPAPGGLFPTIGTAALHADLSTRPILTLVETPVALDAEGGLFERMRAGQDHLLADARRILDSREAVPERTPPHGGGPSGPGGGDELPPVPVSEDDQALVRWRDAAIAEIERELVRRLKRALQVEHNELLDRLRRAEHPYSPDDLLPPLADGTARLAEAARPHVQRAAACGARLAAALLPGARAHDPARSVTADRLAGEIVAPLHRHLSAVLLERREEEFVVVAEAVGVAYREARTVRAERVAHDEVVGGFSAGTLAALPGGTGVRWITSEAEGPCADCEDNALEVGLHKGSAFPTGQAHPPAHEGCRCLLVPVVTP
ncbi:MAG TPA: hypothetical protein VKV25_00625 [Acidimicrobiales bacterium]|nr:hypothetical protein [Acidimicrobiales bacterium]